MAGRDPKEAALTAVSALDRRRTRLCDAGAAMRRAAAGCPARGQEATPGIESPRCTSSRV
jgi:hypothetical protein